MAKAKYKVSEQVADWWTNELFKNLREPLFPYGVDMTLQDFCLAIFVGRFKKSLTMEIDAMLDLCDQFTLITHDKPEGVLDKVAKETGMFTHGFPKNTTMWISKTNATVHTDKKETVTIYTGEPEDVISTRNVRGKAGKGGK